MRKLISLFVSALFAISAWAVELQVSYEYVDLGLSVKWATCNLGATSSTDAGWYLAWGETSPKTNCTWGTYLSDLGGTMTSWQDAGTDKDPLKDYVYGGSHSEGIGATAYDAATAALGAGYRMPTQTEFAELANTDNCEWVWYDKGNTEFNGVAGYKVTSKKTGYTGNSIFLPVAGYRDGERLYYGGSDGYYWSSTPLPDYAGNACLLYFYSDYVKPSNHDYRYYGFPVRPVYDVPDPIAQITTDKGTTSYYSTSNFVLAFSGIYGKGNVQLLSDITLSGEIAWFGNGINSDITFNLNGHNITNNIDENAVFYSYNPCSLTIEGNGLIECTGEKGAAVEADGGDVVINGGTYVCDEAICVCFDESEVTINSGKFKASALYFIEEGSTKPIVKGGIFSMDPSDCVAEGYAAVPNDDEDTKADYPYKVVEKSLVPTAIESIEADKAQKAVKTIENGRVVIIRGEKKYDLSGREL